MGHSGAERKRRRRLALAARRSHAPQQPNKFILPPEKANAGILEAAIADSRRATRAENRIWKKIRKGKKSATKLRRRIQNIVSEPDALEVTIQWGNGARKTFKLPKDGESSVPIGEKQTENTDGPFNEEPKPVYSASAMRAEAGMPDERSPSIDPEDSEAQKTASDLPEDTRGFKYHVSLPRIKQDGVALTQPALSRRPPVSRPEIADSQASEDSFHDSHEYSGLGKWVDTACCTRGTQTTPKARRVGSVGTPLGHSPELTQPSGDGEMDEQAGRNISCPPVSEETYPQPPELCQETEDIAPSSPPSRKLAGSSTGEHGISDACSVASQELPALHGDPEHPPPTTQLTTPYKSPQKKRNYDPYEITPTPPKKRLLRSTGKLFATPPWKMESEQKSQSAPGVMKTPALRRSGLLRGKQVVSEEELVSIFSDPDPEFDQFDGDVPNPDTAAASANCTGALAETSKGNMNAKEGTLVMPSRSRAVREWKDDKGELSDDSSYTGVMSTPLRNYGMTPRITSQPRPGLISVKKPTPRRRTEMRSKSSSRSRRSVSRDTAERIAELPTSATAHSMASSPGSKASTRPTSPIENAVSKPVEMAMPEQRARRTSMSLVPGIPLSRGRRGSKSKPDTSHCFSNMTPSDAKETPSRGTGIQGSWTSRSLDPVNGVEQEWMETPANHVPAQIEVLIPSFNNLAPRTSELSQEKPGTEKERSEEKTKRKAERKEEKMKRKEEKRKRKAERESKVEEETNKKAKNTPKTEEDTSKKREEEAAKGVKPGKDWVAPEKRTPVPLPPYVAMMMGR